MTVYATIDMSDLATANKFFSSPVGTLGTIAVMTQETYEGSTYLRVPFGSETADAIFAGLTPDPPNDPKSNGGLTAHADMLAAVGSWLDGTIAWCFDIDPAKHGRYVKTSGNWVKAGPIAPLYAYDDNHMKILNDFMLLCQTGFATGHPVLVNDGGGPLVDKIAFPNATDLTNHYMEVDLRAVRLGLPRDLMLGWHLQGEMDSAPRVGSGNGGAGSFPLVNAMNLFNIKAALGFGNAPITSPSTIDYVHDSGDVTVRIPFSPSDAWWTMMLGNEDKDGHEGAAYNKTLHYIGTSAKRLVAADVLKINAYLGAFRWNPNPGVPGANTRRPRTAPAFEPSGRLLIKQIRFGS